MNVGIYPFIQFIYFNLFPFTGAINEMLECHDKGALQVILVSGGTFDAFVSLLQKTAVSHRSQKYQPICLT